MAPKRRNSDAGGAFKHKRSRDMLSISEKVKILDMIEIENKSYAEIARLYGKNESFIREVIKNKEKIRASFSVAPQTVKVTAMARDKVLMKVEKALNFWVEDVNRKRVPHFITLCYYFNVGNILLCVIYQLNFTVFMYVTRISRYI
jgi:phage portal protein BeeE